MNVSDWEGLPSVADTKVLNALLARTRALLGESFDELRRIFLRRRARVASPEKLHPLFDLFEATRDSFDTLAMTRPVVAGFQILWLHHALAVLEPWQGDPSWPDIASAIKTPREFDHAVIMLATARQLEDWGNEVELLRPGLGRTPDFRLTAPGQEGLKVDVKTPPQLQRRGTPLDRQEAVSLVERCLDKAGTGPRGQLAPGGPALLVIGGCYMGQANREAFEHGAQDLVASGRIPPHLFGVLCVTLGTRFQNLTLVEEGRLLRPATAAGGRLDATLSFGMAGNPGYSYNGRAGIRYLRRSAS